jgi:hypothetical protein
MASRNPVIIPGLWAEMRHMTNEIWRTANHSTLTLAVPLRLGRLGVKLSLCMPWQNMEECKYIHRVMHSYPQHQMEVSGQVRVLTTYPLGNSLWHPLNRKTGDPQNWSACFGGGGGIYLAPGRNQTIPCCPKLCILLPVNGATHQQASSSS